MRLSGTHDRRRYAIYGEKAVEVEDVAPRRFSLFDVNLSGKPSSRNNRGRPDQVQGCTCIQALAGGICNFILRY
jgi:hypothetical protein